MFISKLVCDKCGTAAGTNDKFCRECGTKGTPDKEKVLDAKKCSEILEQHKKEASPRCRTCGEVIQGYTGHVCKGLIQKQPSKFYGDNIRYYGEEYPTLGKIYTNEIKLALI